MLAAIELAENGCKRKIHIIAGGIKLKYKFISFIH